MFLSAREINECCYDSNVESSGISSPLFIFALRPLSEVAPWGPDRQLHWFGLTDGWYWISVADAELFQYSPAILRIRSKSIEGQHACYVDYNVSRLWEDVLELLPWALEVVPLDILDQRHWVERIISKYYDSSSPLQANLSDEFLDLSEAATNWWSVRELNRGYLVASPFIRIWRDADVVWIAWDNRECVTGGVAVWTAGRGEASFSLDFFISEVNNFRDRLMIAMQQRVDEIKAYGAPAGIRIDAHRLVVEQHERFEKSAAPIDRRATTNWDRVRTAIMELRQTIPENV